MNEHFKQDLKHAAKSLHTASKWVILAVLSGSIIGITGAAFCLCMNGVTEFRMEHPVIICFLPAGGVCIAGIYHLFHNEKDSGTDLVISAIYSNQRVPLRMTPSIFFGTLLTHLFGGSAGREGAALQLGGSLGATFGRFLKLNEKESHIMIMCGMSAAFAALFGTPMAAAIFSMEVISIGIMHYAALVPCVISALIGASVTDYLDLSEHIFQIETLPAFTAANAVLISILAGICAFVSILFCVTLHTSQKMYKKFLPNPYLRAFTGGSLVLALTFLIGNQDYNGTGIHVITAALDGQAVPYAFLLKIIFTALTLGAGLKGGEIVPSLFIGATFGCLFGTVTGFSPTLCAAVGMTSVFCGVTNCPITSLLISFEMFGYEGMPYYLLACAFSYMLSGYFGLYHSQRIMYSKLQTTYINHETQ